MKKTIFIALALVLLFSITAFAVDARSATETARAFAPEGSAYLYTEKDGKFYEVHFSIEETGEEIQITVPADETLPVELETENDFALGSYENTLSEEAVRLAIGNEYPTAQIDTILTVMDDGLFKVHVYFTSLDYYGRVKLNAETGSVIARKIIFAAPLEGWQTELEDDYSEDVLLSENKASGNTASGNKSAKSNSSESPSSNKSGEKSSFISVSQAKSAVTSSHPGAKISEIELDHDDGKYVYEGEARLNGREYDFKVDAVTGKLIKWKLDD